MTKSDAVLLIRSAAETLKAPSAASMTKIARHELADSVLLALKVVGLESRAVPEFDWEDVDYLRAFAKKLRGLPGFHMKNSRIDSLADRIESTLPTRGN